MADIIGLATLNVGSELTKADIICLATLYVGLKVSHDRHHRSCYPLCWFKEHANNGRQHRSCYPLCWSKELAMADI